MVVDEAYKKRRHIPLQTTKFDKNLTSFEENVVRKNAFSAGMIVDPVEG